MSESMPPYGAPVPPMGAQRPVKRGPGPMILIVAGIIVAVVASVVMALGLTNFLSAMPSTDLTRLSTTESTQMKLKASTLYAIYAPRSRSAQADAECTAVSPGGLEIVASDPSGSMTVNGRAQILEFTSQEAGRYTITCTVASSYKSTLEIGEGSQLSGFVGGIFGFVGGILFGIFGWIAAVLMVIGGLVWKAVRA
ncbi:hypothetical protein I6B53_02585 [Schaalia sp. 19OD2882]|uniref:hypothetical protein n=1 Tax=Schaalia sp. 19OD2882 TaxID=2794089 RepID=UPI001C1EBBC6|nr:hypothetical protein [Schaalia sp. 19OD2882]QWW20014.1 hypothetical protein I6B53_02585 [Schaalia sp. 19OD2882]